MHCVPTQALGKAKYMLRHLFQEIDDEYILSGFAFKPTLLKGHFSSLEDRIFKKHSGCLCQVFYYDISKEIGYF